MRYGKVSQWMFWRVFDSGRMALSFDAAMVEQTGLSVRCVLRSRVSAVECSGGNLENEQRVWEEKFPPNFGGRGGVAENIRGSLRRGASADFSETAC